MPAYVINEIVVSDPARFQTYADQVPAILARYGGRYVVRGGAPERVDGPEPEYLAILPIREATSTSRVYLVDGYAG